MKQTLLILIITFGLSESLMAQKVQLPDRISIADKYFSPWGTNLFYEYELERNGEGYTIQRTAIEENGNKKNRKKQIGSIDNGLIEKILKEILENPTNEIDHKDFQGYFPMDSIDMFLKNHADNYWINNEYQKQFITEQLTKPENLKSNLEAYFRNYDHSGYIDGSSTEVELKFHFGDSILEIKSKSILWCGLPIEINGVKNFSPNLAIMIGKLIPESETGREEQFSSDKLFSAVTRETINNHRRKIDNLESKTFQGYIDSLKTTFLVSNTRIINGTYSTNWNGEKRLSCVLRNSSMSSNVSINYSTTIEDGDIKYPVSLIIKDYERLYSQLINSSFFAEYLSIHKGSELSIIYDDNSCFTEKSKEFAMDDCKLTDLEIDFENAIFISLKNEFGNISRWGVLPNRQYFMWWNNGNPPTPSEDKNYLKCN
jgi:hypothetical protein